MVEKKHAPLTYDTLLAGNTWPTLTLYSGLQVAIKEFVTLGQITEMDMVKGTTASSKCSPWRCPSSAPAPPMGLPGSSGQLGTPAVVCRRGCTYGSREKRAAIQEYEDKNMKTMAFSCRVILTRLQRARQQFS